MKIEALNACTQGRNRNTMVSISAGLLAQSKHSKELVYSASKPKWHDTTKPFLYDTLTC